VAVELIPAAAEEGVLLITQKRKFETHAATSQHVHHLHVLRERFCNGSALQAALYGAPIVCTTTSRPSADGRSTPVPSWTWGIRSAMSVGLYTVGRTAGMLTLFGTEPGAFDCESGTIGAVLGSHGAAALQASCAREQLQSALASRDVIGQAKGILMGRFTVDSSHAFGLLYISRAPMPTVARAGRVSVAP
jgi:transcriptional regulator with GAF, ATPase, and Fis domain